MILLYKIEMIISLLIIGSSAMSNHQIYRYKFNDNIICKLTEFAKIHRHDDRHVYREAWNTWWDANADILDTEVRRLQDLGYGGCVQDKMYKAGRYYFREKDDSTKRKAQERRNYIAMSPDILGAMDEHLGAVMYGDDFTPALGYNWFCASYIPLLRLEILRLNTSEALDAEDLIAKMKKTYKNRYFLLRG